jgi:seryl-tRNA synthetase
MLDIKFIRENREQVAQATADKGYDVDFDKLFSLDEERRGLMTKIDDLRAKRNENAAKMKGGKPSDELVTEGKRIKEELAGLEAKYSDIDVNFTTLLKKVPNIPTSDVPIGASEDENVIAKTVGEPAKFDFAPKNHWQIAEARGWIDKERAAKVAGARFAYIKGDLAKLWWAMTQFAINELSDERVIAQIVKDNNLDIATTPFTPVLPPLMIRTEIYDAMDRLEPRDDRYKIEGEDLWLQGSAEHVLGSMHAEEIIEEADLPIRYVGLATSFRREAGSAGKDMEGIFRMHQFDKLEMISLSTKETSLHEHLLMVAIQEHLNQKLELPYHVILKCTADIGKPNARGIDIDTWLPGQGKYRETHTADYMTDYQSRRLQTRVRRTDGDVELVHNNDATAFAQRSMIAVVENYQNADGTVRIPAVLRPYLNNREIL